MRIVAFLLSAAATTALILALNHRWQVGPSKTPPIGRFMSPQTGFWKNAEAYNPNFNIDLSSPLLQDKVDVYLDNRLVPHVFAQNDHDVFFVQGYLHAKFRLWQMELQTHLAAGRLCEILGEKNGTNNILQQSDRMYRRLGMGWAAEKSLAKAEADPDTKAELDAYTQGINFYIEKLNPVDYPIEYKLLDYAPEKWTNLKSIYFIKYMAYDLASRENDFEKTNVKSFLPQDLFNKLYPTSPDSLDPIIPKGTIYDAPSILVKAPLSADSLYFNFADTTKINEQKPDAANGSNNWAVAGTKTASGKPILCGDPHLGLNLPCIWFEIQLHTPKWNAYGVSFPGAPAIAIGFNDSIAWSETNAGRDVRDYYAITFKDASQKEYMYNGAWQQTEWRVDTIKIRDAAPFVDSIPMTVFGPVMYEKRYANKLKDNKAYAVRWKAHDASNESKMFWKMVRAKNYNDFVDAIQYLECAGQNVVFASKSGDIAMWCQGAFPAKWKGQGDFVMPGIDSSYQWQGIIPMAENPHIFNPVRGFVSSANQLPVEAEKYPYYIGGGFDLYRGAEINKRLSAMNAIDKDSMENLQLNNYNLYAATALPKLLGVLYDSTLNDSQKKYAAILRQWNYVADPDGAGQTVYATFMSEFEKAIWNDDLQNRTDLPIQAPDVYTTIEGILKDSLYPFIDNKETPARETLKDIVMTAFQKAAVGLDSIQQKNSALSWGTAKGTEIRHLLRIPAFSVLNVMNGGGTHIINATKKGHGPSWRMVVSLTDSTQAYGVYPGGQSGNPGSRFYSSFVDDWAAGIYYPLWVMKETDANNSNVKWQMKFTKG